MNIKENRQKVLDQIKAYGPEHFDMDVWFGEEKNVSLDVLWEEPESFKEKLKGCGTVACIAGHAAIVLSNEIEELVGWETETHVIIAQLLDLNPEVFFKGRWFGRLLGIYAELDDEYLTAVTYLQELIDNDL